MPLRAWCLTVRARSTMNEAFIAPMWIPQLMSPSVFKLAISGVSRFP